MEVLLQASDHKEGKLRQKTKAPLFPGLRGTPRHPDFYPPVLRSSFLYSIVRLSHSLEGELCNPPNAPSLPKDLPMGRTQTLFLAKVTKDPHPYILRVLLP